MAKKPSPEKPAPSSLLPGFQHLIPSAAAAPLPAHIRPLFLPDLVQQIARNKQIDANRREQAHPAFRKWAKDLKQGVLQQLHETQVEQDFNHVLLRGLGYTTQSDVASDQPWTLTPKWNSRQSHAANAWHRDCTMRVIITDTRLSDQMPQFGRQGWPSQDW